MSDHAASRDRRWLILPVLCLSVFLVVVNKTIVNVALPTLSRHLGASITSLQWIVDAYSLAFAGLLLAGGGIGDRLGRKGTMQVGLIFFGLFSATAAAAHTTGSLIGRVCSWEWLPHSFSQPVWPSSRISSRTHPSVRRHWVSGGLRRASPWPLARSLAGRCSSISGTARSSLSTCRS